MPELPEHTDEFTVIETAELAQLKARIAELTEQANAAYAPYQELALAARDEANKVTAELEAMTKDRDSWRSEWNMWTKAWARELGTVIPKTHLIDSLVLTTREMKARLSQIDYSCVFALAEQHKTTWRDMPEYYWLARLLEEFGELGASLANDHEHPPEVELRQIAAICINWLDMREKGKL